MDELVWNSIVEPQRLWSRQEVLTGQVQVPPLPGVYGWYFRELPYDIDVSGCKAQNGSTLLYVGISPRLSTSQQTLRKRIRQHLRGTAYGSTLRLTLGTLLEQRIGTTLRTVGKGSLTFGDAEARLNEWMDENALVTWVACPTPRTVEEEFMKRLKLPLNLEGNPNNPFAPTLRAIRWAAKETARKRGVTG